MDATRMDAMILDYSKFDSKQLMLNSKDLQRGEGEGEENKITIISKLLCFIFYVQLKNKFTWIPLWLKYLSIYLSIKVQDSFVDFICKVKDKEVY